MITLVLGGARSGKSAVAEALAAEAAGEAGTVVYVATAVCEAEDGDLAARIEAHARRRPSHWRTEELGLAGDLPGLLRARGGVLLVDSLGTWLAGVPGFVADVDALVSALQARRDPTVVVSDEVGMGVHPSTEAGRRFRDALGALNEAVAGVATRVALVVAGRILDLGPVRREHP